MDETHPLKIISVHQETMRAKSYVLDTGDWKPSFRSGQFLTLVFQTLHGEKRRSYSISSVPELHEPLKITVKEHDNGEFSRFLLQHARAGDTLHASGIGGMFTLPEEMGEHELCFIAAGSGITPCFSLIRAALVTTNARITLIYSNSSEADAIFLGELRALESEYAERLNTIFLFSNSSNVFRRRLSKWLLDQLVAQYLPKPAQTLFYLCGPFDYMQMAEIVLRRFTAAENIRKEQYSALPRLVLPEPPDRDEHMVTIESGGKSFSMPVRFPESILAAAKKRGIPMQYSCEAGRCGSCVATCTSGKVWMAYNEVLVDREVEAGRLLTCQAFPVHGDAVIRVD